MSRSGDRGAAPAAAFRRRYGAGRDPGVRGARAAPHRQELRVSIDLPLAVECVDTEEKIEAILPELDATIGGLITLERARLIMYCPPPDSCAGG